MAVVTISRQFGAGGKTLGKMLANKLDYRFFDERIIQEISKKANVSADWVKSMERNAGSKFTQFISGLISRDYIERVIGGDKGYMDETIYVELLNEILMDLANEDNIVIMGRGGQYILSDFEGAYHILLVADIEDRIKFIQRYYKLSSSKAEQAVIRGQKMRTNLYRKLGKEDYNQPQHYHLSLNMSRFSMEQALDQIITMVKN